MLASWAHVGAIVSFAGLAGSVASGLLTAMSCPSVNVGRDPGGLFHTSHPFQGPELSGLPVVGAVAPT